MYSIKAITTLTGLTPETLRAWERRYIGISPARSLNGRRSYSQDELDKLILLAELTRNGHAISKIAHLDTEALTELKQQNEQSLILQQSPLLTQLIEALQDYRIDRCEELLKKALIASEPLEFVRDILLPALSKVGDLWHQSKINIAQEHMFSSCVKRIILSLINSVQQNAINQPAMLFATPSDEPHEFGILCCTLLASVHRYRCYYLGANLPAPDIIEASQHLKPDIMVLGLTKTPPSAETVEQLQVILNSRDKLYKKTEIWIGGSGSRKLLLDTGQCRKIENIEHFYRMAQH